MNKKITIKDLEAKLLDAANTLRGSLSAEYYMHVVLGILTIKFINDKNESVIKKMLSDGWNEDDIDYTDLRARNAFVVPEKAKWSYILEKVGTNEIGFALDDAVSELGNANEELKGIFISSYNDEEIDKTRLGAVVKIFQSDNISEHGEDILGRIYEYFLGNFFLKRGQKGGEFYTPKSIVKLITLFLNPKKGKLYDPCCGTAGMLVQAKQHLEESGDNVDNITVYGQEFISTTWKLAKLNLLLNGLNIFNLDEFGDKEGALGERAADTFTNDQHKGKLFDYIMANPPFNLKKYWSESLNDDPRWIYGIPPNNNANFAWIQHILYKMNNNAKAGVVMANGSLTSATSNENKIREKIIKDNKVSCIISLPDKLFFTTQIAACIWFFDNKKKNTDILMIDAQNMGQLIEGSKKNKEIPDDELIKLKEIFDKFQNGEKINIKGLAKSVSLKEIEENEFLLSPGRYIDLKEDEKRSNTEIQKDLNESIDELLKLMQESKQIENDVINSIKKIRS